MKLLSTSSRDGVWLARSWLKWMSTNRDVPVVSMSELWALVDVPDHRTKQIKMLVDPDKLAIAYDLLLSEGRHFWPAIVEEEEIAWHMLRADLDECIGSMDDSTSQVQIFVGKRSVSVIDASHES